MLSELFYAFLKIFTFVGISEFMYMLLINMVNLVLKLNTHVFYFHGRPVYCIMLDNFLHT